MELLIGLFIGFVIGGVITAGYFDRKHRAEQRAQTLSRVHGLTIEGNAIVYRDPQSHTKEIVWPLT